MKISGFILDTDEAFDRCLEWARAGLINRCYLQAEHWPHAAKNRAAFPKYKAALNPLGVQIYATLWIDNVAAIPERITALRAEIQPQGWCLNMESPPKENEGANVALMMQATKPEPVVVSYNVPASRLGFDFRRFAFRGCEVHGQAYDGDGNSNVGPFPVAHVTEAFKPAVAWSGGGGPAWWYRIKVGKTYKWAWVVGFNPGVGKLEMKGAGGGLYWADGHFDGTVLRFAPTRVLRAADTVTVVGSVLGFATYPKIGYSVGTTRPITPQKLAELASQARAPGMALCKNVDVYTFENSSTEQIKALAGVGVKRSPRYRPCTGTICPTCASPKGWQAVVCRACWLDNLRAECAVTEHGVERGRYRCYCEPCVEAVRRFHRKKRRRLGLVRGTGTGRPQPASHPWRRKSLLTEGAA